jgi:hypothetical protein
MALSKVGLVDVTAITGETALAETPADTDEVLINDGGTIKRIDFSFLKSVNTPSFYGYLASDQTISASTWTKMSIATESWDTDSAFASNKFTVPSGEAGKYCIGYSVGSKEVLDNTERLDGKLYKNGSAIQETLSTNRAPADNVDMFINFTTVLDLSASDYVELYARHTDANNQDMDAVYTRFWAFKLTGV